MSWLSVRRWARTQCLAFWVAVFAFSQGAALSLLVYAQTVDGNAARLQALQDRLAAVEAQRIDARMSVVERELQLLHESVDLVQRWNYGIMATLLGNLVATALGAKELRKTRSR